jgi:hypothetical protein
LTQALGDRTDRWFIEDRDQIRQLIWKAIQQVFAVLCMTHMLQAMPSRILFFMPQDCPKQAQGHWQKVLISGALKAIRQNRLSIANVRVALQSVCCRRNEEISINAHDYGAPSQTPVM